MTFDYKHINKPLPKPKSQDGGGKYIYCEGCKKVMSTTKYSWHIKKGECTGKKK